MKVNTSQNSQVCGKGYIVIRPRDTMKTGSFNNQHLPFPSANVI